MSDVWGRDRGSPLDRYYIEQFLARERQCIRGHVLEVLDDAYTRRFGVDVDRSDVLDIDGRNANATIVADLQKANDIPSESFDCFILTQTLQFIYDTQSAVENAFRILRPGGVLLCTVPSVSRIARRTLESEYWRFTAAGCRALFGEVFGGDRIRVESHGNVLTAMAFLTGLATEELSQRELDVQDPYFPVVITVRAEKAPSPAAR